MLGKVLAAISILSGVLLLMLVNFTTPTSVGPIGILVFFLLLYLVCLGLLTGVVFLLVYTASVLTRDQIRIRPILPISVKRAYYFSSVLSLAPILFLAIQSFGGISFLEFGLIIAFIALGCILVAKR